MVLSLVSELSGLAMAPSVVVTGTIGVKFDVGPVGGLGGYGTQTGKIVGILKSRRVSDLMLPVANFESASDEMRILAEEGMTLHPVRKLTECQKIAFGVDASIVAEKIKERDSRQPLGQSS
jgi:ATP-dependent Lon protease